MKRLIAFAAVLGLTATVFADGNSVIAEPKWRNLDEEHHFGGRQTSAGYLRGKVVLVDCCDYTDIACVERVKILKDIWMAYKTKPFVIIGSHRGKHLPVKVARVCDGLGITYPVYEDAGVPDDQKDDASYFYLIDANGQIRVCANELGKVQATIGSAIMAAKMPGSSKKWREMLDYETKYLPGAAYNHLKEFRKKDPLGADAYNDFWEKASESNEIKQLATLEEVARIAKDCDYGDKRAKKPPLAKLESSLKKFEKLKESEDPIIVQEAKNCLADITWAILALKNAK